MKRTGILLVLFSFVSLLFAQVPEGIKYQAVARDGDGNILGNTTLHVRLGILRGNNPGELLWQEEHEVTTSSVGLFSLVLGDTAATRTGGSLDSFRDIDWSTGDLFMETAIDLTGSGDYLVLGVSPVLAVPYAYYAGSVGSLDKLKIYPSGDVTSGDALFEVKRADGQTVFAVYNDSIRMYVNDTPDKALRGGFAIGGYDAAKGLTHEYMRVSPDSVRIFFNKPAGKALRGGFAIGGYDAAKGGVSQYFNVSAENNVRVINPSEPRVMWYPVKEAFLAGRVLIESPDSVGLNSLSIGYETKAIGQWSTAMGFKSVAAQDYSLSIGLGTRAAGFNSFALGFQSQALNEGAYAFGTKVIASGLGSFAFGAPGVDASGNVLDKPTRASGDYSFAFGLGTLSRGLGSMSMGANNVARGAFSVALGSENLALGDGSVSLGFGSEANGKNSFAMGDNSVANGYGAVALGEGTLAEKNYSFSVGFQASAKGENAISMGYITSAAGDFSLAAGAHSEANGKQSVAFGGGHANADQSMALGFGTIARSYGSLVLGRFNDDRRGINNEDVSPGIWKNEDPILVVGNGTGEANLHNALILYKNGDMKIAGNLVQESDQRLKTDIRPLNGVLSRLDVIQPVYYRFKDQQIYPSGDQIGILAQEVQKTFPELVMQGGDGYLSVDYSKMTAVLLQAIKEQQQVIEKLSGEVNRLRGEKDEVASLKKQIADLKKMIILMAENK